MTYNAVYAKKYREEHSEEIKKYRQDHKEQIKKCNHDRYQRIMHPLAQQAHLLQLEQPLVEPVDQVVPLACVEHV